MVAMESAVSQDKVTRIHRRERVERILARVFDAHLELLIRTTNNLKVAVRGKASLIDLGQSPPSLFIGHLSPQGCRYLAQATDVRVEFVGMATQIVFFAKCFGVTGDTVRLSMPSELTSFDRRANNRATVVPKLSAFMKLGNWFPRDTDLTAPPILDLYQDLANWVPLADISEGGACLTSRFPSVLDRYERGMVDDHAELILPLHTPIIVPIEVRWTRRIKDSKTEEDRMRYQRFFKIGIQFRSVDEQTTLTIKQYMNQLTVAEAI
jgi:hypothetical protein